MLLSVEPWVFPYANKWFRCRDRDLHERSVMSYHWNPTKKEIETWLDRKIHELTVQENKNLQLTKEQWLDKYLDTDIHEIFFCTFPIKLYEWITKLADDQGRWRLDDPIVWTPELVRILEASKDKIACAVDHWPVIFSPKISNLIYKLAAQKHSCKKMKKKEEKFFPLCPRKCSVEDVAHA